MCIFCDIVNGEIPSFKIYEDDKCLAFLDIVQVTKGHTLVIPKKHYDNFLEIDPEDLKQLMLVSQNVANHITDKTGCKGMNILSNVNEIAGQSVKHVHFHLIPRYHNNDYVRIEFLKHGSINIEKTHKLITE